MSVKVGGTSEVSLPYTKQKSMSKKQNQKVINAKKAAASKGK